MWLHDTRLPHLLTLSAYHYEGHYRREVDPCGIVIAVTRVTRAAPQVPECSARRDDAIAANLDRLELVLLLPDAVASEV
jgi:hypothetical protein